MAWVPFAPGFEVPCYFDYLGEEPFSWKIGVAVFEGRLQCVQLACWSLDPLRPVTPELVHRLPLGRLLMEAALMASRPSDEVPRRYRGWADPDQARAAHAAVAAQYRKRSNEPRPRTLTDEFLTEVADVYRQHVASRKPSRAVAEHFHYTADSARRVVHEARRRGLLGPARPGRGGEQAKEDKDG